MFLVHLIEPAELQGCVVINELGGQVSIIAQAIAIDHTVPLRIQRPQIKEAKDHGAEKPRKNNLVSVLQQLHVVVDALKIK